MMLGPLAGTEAWVDADSGEGFDGYDVTASLPKLMRFGGSPLPGTQAQGTSTVLCANGEKHQTKVYGFTSALRGFSVRWPRSTRWWPRQSGGAEHRYPHRMARSCSSRAWR